MKQILLLVLLMLVGSGAFCSQRPSIAQKTCDDSVLISAIQKRMTIGILINLLDSAQSGKKSVEWRLKILAEIQKLKSEIKPAYEWNDEKTK